MGTPNFTPIRLGLDDFVQGGLVSDVPVEILQIQFRGWDYNGSVQKDILTVWMQLGLLDDNLKRTTDEPVENFWSAGGELEEVVLSDDGYQVGILNSTGAKSAMTKGSNFEIFLQSLSKPINGGPAMPKNWLRDNQSSLKCLLGAKFHMLRTPAPKREGIDTSGRKRKDFEPTIATAIKVYWAPWSPKTQGGKVTRTAASAPAPAPVNGPPAPDTTTQATTTQSTAADSGSSAVDEISIQAKQTVQNALKETPIFEKIDDLKIACFRLHHKTKADTRNAIVKLIADPNWLKGQGFNVQDDGMVVA